MMNEAVIVLNYFKKQLCGNCKFGTLVTKDWGGRCLIDPENKRNKRQWYTCEKWQKDQYSR
jgi:hypothetical protein